jgi:hypothetical protein
MSYKLSVCAIFNNEARFIDEWLNFHFHQGVEHFFLYNDRSEDHYQEVLAPWIKKGLVTLTDWPEKNLVQAYNHCLNLNRSRTKWIAFIDLDEFLFSPTGKTLAETLDSYNDCAAIFVYWALFGSAGHESEPDEGVLESYTLCQSIETAHRDNFDHGTPGTENHVTSWSKDGKSVIQTSAISVMDNHQAREFFWGESVDENKKKMPKTARERRHASARFSYSILRINHYWSKSIETMIVRRTKRGCVFDRSRPPRTLSRVLERDKMLNEVEDRTILEKSVPFKK